ncbi:hypothetical protein [Polaribacter porphyrae]|uniref:Lipoprotein n=1 Tax=Polaribacter porphyrae TaxID=1137780 RepID=A0A2S7WRT2_9FLAO|nr:hypothetical protein [Polaribacter porphyrae]PQJ80022.1 hypothetical protein BTO18_12945 [Polaribacter porphyrae]
MKKVLLFIFGLLLFYACSVDNDQPNFRYELLTVDDYIVPTSFTFGQQDTIKVKYSLTNGCYSFDNIYYQYQDTARIVAVRAFVMLDETCTDVVTEGIFDLIVTPIQRQDYLFKFWKGTDSNGENIFEEVVVPVN